MSVYNITLFDTREFIGFWFLPGKESEKVPGTLSFDNSEGIKLKIWGAINQEDKIYPHFPVILGTTIDNTRITILDVYCTWRDASVKETKEMHFDAYLLLINQHVESESGKAFLIDRARVNFTNMEDWTKISPIEWSSGDTENGRSARGFQSPYLEDIEGRIESIKSSFSIDLAVPSSSIRPYSLDWRFRSFLYLTPDEPRDVYWYIEQINEVSYLIALLVGAPIYPKDIQLLPNSISQDQYEIPAILLYRQPRISVEKYLVSNKIFIDMPSIQDSLAEIFESWFEKKDRLRLVRELFFGTVYSDRLYQRFIFLSYAQALESFHRAKKTGIYIPKDQYRNLKDTLLSHIPSDIDSSLKDSLESRISHGNEYTLRTRLKELIDDLGNRLSSLIVRYHFEEDFIKKVVNTRNYFTHNDITYKNKALSGNDLYHANEMLRFLLIILLLQELNIEEEIIFRGIRDSLEYFNFENRERIHNF